MEMTIAFKSGDSWTVFPVVKRGVTYWQVTNIEVPTLGIRMTDMALLEFLKTGNLV